MAATHGPRTCNSPMVSPSASAAWHVRRERDEDRLCDHYFGKTIFEARAPAAGVVLYICSVPSMKKDDAYREYRGDHDEPIVDNKLSAAG
ncbi:MAG TPA: hypothetical protein VFP71_05280 [Candidatus Angelobacter sp.]|nr:hypothetical protein [Candidatus Angelobacter sp.]